MGTQTGYLGSNAGDLTIRVSKLQCIAVGGADRDQLLFAIIGQFSIVAVGILRLGKLTMLIKDHLGLIRIMDSNDRAVYFRRCLTVDGFQINAVFQAEDTDISAGGDQNVADLIFIGSLIKFSGHIVIADPALAPQAVFLPQGNVGAVTAFQRQLRGIQICYIVKLRSCRHTLSVE